MTAPGTIIGTAAYMSPEQARGKSVDKRTDVWAFGAVLYEMLTGERAFKGRTPTDVLAAVVQSEPDWSKAPAKFQRLLRRCLEKEPKLRLRHIDDFELLIDEAATADRPTNALPWVVAAVLAVVAVIALIGWLRTTQPVATAPSDVALSLLPPSGKQLAPLASLSLDRISPNGSAVLFRAYDSRFHVRKLNSLATEDLPYWQWGGDSFWAPDSQSIAFPTLDIVRLMKMRVPTGAPEVVCTIHGSFRGGSWGEKGEIVFATADKGLFHVAAAGGTAARLDIPGLKEGGYYYPEFLPGGEDFLFAYVAPGSTETQIYLATLNSGRALNPRLLMRNETAAAFTPALGGRLLFVRNDNLYSQKLDLRTRQLGGDAELVQENVASYAGTRIAYFTVARNGTLVWRSGTAVNSQVTIFDRKGNRLGIAGGPAPVNVIALTPDESRLAIASEAGAWIVDAHGPGLTPIKYGEDFPGLFWSPDSSRILFRRDGKLWEILTDGSGRTRQVADSVIETANREPELAGGEVSDNLALSPDGSWVAYTPRRGFALNAQPVSGATVPRQIATNAFFPVWRADGKEILYLDRGRLMIMSVGVMGAGKDLSFGDPQALFSVRLPLGTNSGSKTLAVSRDGSRIYVLQSTEESDAGVIQVRTNAIR
jgi:hypothetical protein